MWSCFSPDAARVNMPRSRPARFQSLCLTATEELSSTGGMLPALLTGSTQTTGKSLVVSRSRYHPACSALGIRTHVHAHPRAALCGRGGPQSSFLVMVLWLLFVSACEVYPLFPLISREHPFLSIEFSPQRV